MARNSNMNIHSVYVVLIAIAVIVIAYMMMTPSKSMQPVVLSAPNSNCQNLLDKCQSKLMKCNSDFGHSVEKFTNMNEGFGANTPSTPSGPTPSGPIQLYMPTLEKMNWTPPCIFSSGGLNNIGTLNTNGLQMDYEALSEYLIDNLVPNSKITSTDTIFTKALSASFPNADGKKLQEKKGGAATSRSVHVPKSYSLSEILRIIKKFTNKNIMYVYAGDNTLLNSDNFKPEKKISAIVLPFINYYQASKDGGFVVSNGIKVYKPSSNPVCTFSS